MHFDDLSLYCYELPHPLAMVRNVGWLNNGKEYTTGDVPPGFLDVLKQLAVRAAANRMRGYEPCRFCPHVGYAQVSMIWKNQQYSLGSSEIWIPDGKDGIFAAPNLIVHYVECHNYLPPSEFVEAVLRPLLDGWDAQSVADMLIRSAFQECTYASTNSLARASYSKE